ncbi:uncharacterized protein [Arachis hypogaea]|uniref:uncharacterized protein n=1 Tax=Arachis hypogaea TaxID=3818 RepID=UPI003B217EB4
MEVPQSMEASQSMRSSVQDPYALQPGDHSGLVLTFQPLQEDNYAFWSRSIRLALRGKRKLGFIDGSITKPDSTIDPMLAESWQYTNDMVTTWLLNSISKDIAASVIYAGSAALLWQDLEIRFSQSNGPRIFEMKKALVTLTQAFAVNPAPTAHRGQPANQYRGKENQDCPLCTQCGLLGHTQDKCYKLHGYPPGYNQNKQRNQVNLVAETISEQEKEHIADKDSGNNS